MSDFEHAASDCQRWHGWVLGVLALFVVGGCVQRGEPEAGRPSAEAAPIQASNALSSDCSTSAVDDARFSCRRILLINESPHPLMAKVASLLQEELGKVQRVDRVLYDPAGAALPDGELAPDLVIRLELDAIDEQNKKPSRTLTARVTLAMTTDLIGGPGGYHDSFSPPVVSIEYRGTLEHKSQSIDDDLGDDQYRLTAGNIAGQFAGSLKSAIAGWQAEHGSVPELPAAFYGDYRPAEDLAFLDEAGARRLGSFRGLLRHNETAWRFTDARDARIVLGEMRQKLEAKGWKQVEGRDADSSFAFFWMEKDDRLIHAFRRQGSAMAPGAAIYGVHHLGRYSQREREAAMTQLLDSSASAETLLAFKSLCNSTALRARLYAAMEKEPPTSARACLRLAIHCREQRKDDEKARQYLHRAAILSRIAEEGAPDLDGAIRELAGKLGDEKLADSSLTEALMHGMGIVELNGDAPFERIVGVGDAVLLSGRTSRGDRCTLCVKVVDATTPNAPGPYELVCIISGEQGRISGRGTSASQAGPWSAVHEVGLNGFAPRAQAVQLPDGRFQVTVSKARE